VTRESARNEYVLVSHSLLEYPGFRIEEPCTHSLINSLARQPARPLSSLFGFRLIEDARNARPAVGASAVLQPVRHHRVPRARYDNLLASRADRVAAIGIDVAFVHVVQPHLHRNPARAMQCL